MPQLANLSQRCSEITIFSVIVTLVICIFNLLMFDHNSRNNPQMESFKILSVPVFRINPYYNWDQATIMMSLHTKTLAVHSINLKHVYFFIAVEFMEPSKRLTSEQIIYDEIIPVTSASTERELQVHRDNFQSRYPLRDIHKTLRGAEIRLSFYCVYVPHYVLKLQKLFHQEKYKMPQKYTYTVDKNQTT